jgi:FAD/FMN-containing dehydrogenase
MFHYPQTLEEAAGLFREAGRRGLAIVPAGLLGSLPRLAVLEGPDAAVISARELRRLDPDPGNLLAVAGAGLTPAEVNRALAPAGFYWPVTGLDGRSLGGILAEGLAGAETMARGSAADWILGTTLISPEGQIIKSGGRTLKDVSGYDLTRLAWRSRGRLGLVGELALKLLPRPALAPVWAIDLADAAEGADLAERLIESRLWPEGLRLAVQGRAARLAVWLTGFPEAVEAAARAVGGLAGGHRLTRRENGWAWFQEHGCGWPAGDPSIRRFLGSRREVLALAREMARYGGEGLRADLDIGGGRVTLAPAGETLDRLLANRPGLIPDRFISSGPVYERLKKELDPRGLVFPDNLEFNF